MHDLIIIGGGPAGLAAASYALGKKLNVALICARLGGKAGDRQRLVDQIVREHLIGEAAVRVLSNEVVEHPGIWVDDYVVGITRQAEHFQVVTEGRLFEATSVIIATGAQPTKLGIPNERALVGYGLGYSISTHAHLVAGRDVAVVGSHARAMRGVAELAQIAHRVVVVAPTTDQLESRLGQRLAAHARVHILQGYTIAEIEAPAGAVQAILVKKDTATHRVPVEAVFVELGLVPNTQMVRQLVAFDRGGFIVVDEHNQTSKAGIFAAGDVTSAIGEQILIAIGDGARAAQGAYDYILAQRLSQPEQLLSRSY